MSPSTLCECKGSSLHFLPYFMAPGTQTHPVQHLTPSLHELHAPSWILQLSAGAGSHHTLHRHNHILGAKGEGGKGSFFSEPLGFYLPLISDSHTGYPPQEPAERNIHFHQMPVIPTQDCQETLLGLEARVPGAIPGTRDWPVNREDQERP